MIYEAEKFAYFILQNLQFVFFFPTTVIAFWTEYSYITGKKDH